MPPLTVSKEVVLGGQQQRGLPHAHGRERSAHLGVEPVVTPAAAAGQRVRAAVEAHRLYVQPRGQERGGGGGGG